MSVNKAILVGNLGADPETRTSGGGMAICNLRVATSERIKRGESWEDHTEWHRVVCFGKTAENAARYLSKGRTVYVEGRIRANKWTDKEGVERVTTEILADEVRFIGGGEGREQRGAQAGSRSQGATRGGASTSRARPSADFDPNDTPF